MEESSIVPKRKKRSAEDASLALTGSAGTSGSSTMIRSSYQTLVLEQQMHHLQFELEHERSMRTLDEKKARQIIERLEKQVELSETAAAEATTALEDYRRTNEERIKALRESNDKTLQRLRECEIKLLDNYDDEDEDGTESESPMVDFYKGKCEQLETLLEHQKENEDELGEKLEKLQEELEKLKTNIPVTMDPTPLSPKIEKMMEEAPSDVMKELHRIRLNHAESQRRERQLQRKSADMEQRNRRLIQEREEFRIASQRLPVVENELNQVHEKFAKMQAEHEAWQEFGRDLRKVLKLSPQTTNEGILDISLVEQALAQSRSQASNVELQSQAWQGQRQRLQAQLEAKDTTILELEKNLSKSNNEKASLEQQGKDLQAQVERTKAHVEVFKREAENLRELVQTFDELPLASAAESKAADLLKSPKLDTSKRTLQISLDSARDELRLSDAETERLKQEIATNTAELDRVKEKFGKLKEALQREKGKAAEAEQRANEAEALAGKGSFNPEQTRVIHFTETPLVEAMKAEIKVLKRQVEAGKHSKPSSKTAHHNLDKLNQRLKENFKEQIAMFREGVYLMTGFKVDMLPNTDRPTFRVRSVYSASEQDHLLLKWPKTSDVSSLDILNTDFAKSLSGTPSYQYMTKFHSLPAFLASVQLSLFENTTMVV